MSNTEIQEGNKLIAEFMGGKHNGGSYYDFYEGLQIQGFSDGKRPASWSEATLKYHSSWDWLMPAWKSLYHKISALHPMPYIKNELGEHQYALQYWYMHMEQPLTKVLISIAWKNLIEAIQWYNQNKNP